MLYYWILKKNYMNNKHCDKNYVCPRCRNNVFIIKIIINISYIILRLIHVLKTFLPTPYQSEDPSPTLPSYRGKEEKGKIVEDKKTRELLYIRNNLYSWRRSCLSLKPLIFRRKKKVQFIIVHNRWDTYGALYALKISFR